MRTGRWQQEWVRDGRLFSRIGTVMCRRCALVALIIYVTLDLSLPAMPGAFVFEPDQSVESARMNRERAAGDVGSLAVPLPSAFAAVPRISDQALSRPVSRSIPIVHGVISRLPRAALTSAPTSEDPQ